MDVDVAMVRVLASRREVAAFIQYSPKGSASDGCAGT
jgi:hypothetical protein